MTQGAQHLPQLKEWLLKEAVLTQDVLHEILSQHDKSGKHLIDILIEFGHFDEKKLVHLFTQHYNYPPINPAVFVIDRELIQLIPKEIAEKFTVLPISRFENTLTVAFANPANVQAIEEVQARSGLRVKVAVAEVSRIRNYQASVYAQEVEASGGVDAGESRLEEIDDLIKMIEVEKEEQEDKKSLLKIAYETPVIKLVNVMVIEGIRRGASDIFVEPWENFVRVRARVDGLLEEILKPPKSLGAAIVSRIKIMSDLDIAEHRIPQDGRFKVKVKGREVDMRVSVLPTSHGEKVCMRILDTQAQSHDISSLGFSLREQQVIKDSAQKPHGMILVTGPTGSGTFPW